MHFNTVPFSPHDDSPVNVLLHDEPMKTFKDNVNSGVIKIELPEHCTFNELSIINDRQEIMNFGNRHHCDSIWKRIITDDEMDHLTDAGNASFYGIRWKGMLISLMSLEKFNVMIHGSSYIAAFIDYSTVHPKFRKTGLHNTMIALIYLESIKHGCSFLFFTGDTKLNFKPCAVKPLYIYPLTSILQMCGISSNQPNKPFTIRRRTIRTATLDELKMLNHKKEFDVYLTYDDQLLCSMLKHYYIYTDGKCVLCFVPDISNINNVAIKQALLVDWTNLSCPVFKEAVEELRSAGFDAVSFTNDGELKDLMMNIPFEKKNDAYYWTMNILPKTRKGRINLTVR